jgi:antitoxin component of MazEF toxin-antitoxin module
MIKRLSRHGNSLALVLDKGILELLKIAPETPLEITTDGERLIVQPVKKTTKKGARPRG